MTDSDVRTSAVVQKFYLQQMIEHFRNVQRHGIISFKTNRVAIRRAELDRVPKRGFLGLHNFFYVLLRLHLLLTAINTLCVMYHSHIKI
jgi:hypothetical protein